MNQIFLSLYNGLPFYKKYVANRLPPGNEEASITGREESAGCGYLSQEEIFVNISSYIAEIVDFY